MFKKSEKKTPTKKNVESYILWFLSKRDYSIKELIDKVNLKYINPKEEFDYVLEKFKKLGYIDEQRFASSYIRIKSNNGYGKISINLDLKMKKGIKDEYFIKNEFEKYDWFELAKELRIRKFGEEIETDKVKFNKQKNFLLRRGFSFEEISYAFENKGE